LEVKKTMTLQEKLELARRKQKQDRKEINNLFNQLDKKIKELKEINK
jgi:hypothetical protein